MDAFVLERYGRKADLHLRQVPEPEVGPHDVLVKVHAASVNPLDTKIRAGLLRLVVVSMGLTPDATSKSSKASLAASPPKLARKAD